MEKVIDLDDTRAIEIRATSAVEQAKLIQVIDSASYEKAGIVWKGLKTLMAEIDTFCNKNIARWHEGHKAAIAENPSYRDNMAKNRYIEA